MRRIFKLLVLILLLGAIVLPTALSEIKAVILVFSVLAAGYLLLREKIKIPQEFALLWLLYPVLGLGWSLYGLAMGNPGAIRVLTVMVLYPLALPIIAFCYRPEYDDGIFRVLRVAAWILVLLNLAYILGSLAGGGVVVDWMLALFGDNAMVDDATDYFKFTLPNISSLLFLIPCFFVALISGYSKAKFLDAVLIFFMILIGVLSGRRALFLALIMGPFLAYIFTLGVREQASGVTRYKGMIALGLVLFFAVASFVSFERSTFYVDQFFSIFDFSENASNVERRLQFASLHDGWRDAPLFGAGAGAAAGYSRSQEQPWAYELSYVAFVFQYGLIGFLLYAAGIIFLAHRLILFVKHEGRSSFSFCILSGVIAFLVANATNPYLSKFDFMWVVFLPFAMASQLTRRGLNG
jgi:hypothetical protein